MKKIFYLAAGIIILQSCNSSDNADTTKASESTTTTTTSVTSKTANKINNDNLAGFMLGGIYFIDGYGGIDAVYSNFIGNDNATTKEIEEAYEQNLIYPFTPEQGPQIKAMLTSDWGVTDKNSFLKNQEWLINEGHQKEFDTLKNIIAQNGGDSADIAKIDISKLQLGIDKETLEKRLKFIKDHYAQFSQIGIKAWDIARYVNQVCAGYAAGYITKEEGNAMVIKILPIARATYKDWADYYKAFELGRKYWGEDEANDAKYAALVKDMLNGDKKSIFTYLSFK